MIVYKTEIISTHFFYLRKCNSEILFEWFQNLFITLLFMIWQHNYRFFFITVLFSVVFQSSKWNYITQNCPRLLFLSRWDVNTFNNSILYTRYQRKGVTYVQKLGKFKFCSPIFLVKLLELSCTYFHYIF